MKVDILLRGGERRPIKRENDKKLKIQRSWRHSCLMAFAFGSLNKTLGFNRL